MNIGRFWDDLDIVSKFGLVFIAVVAIILLILLLT